jgi:monothiol glutaredoxin
LKFCSANFAYVNILDNQDIRQTLPIYANWPTFPQLYLKGDLIGGCDIITEMFENEELQQQLQAANVVGDKMQTTEASE